MRRNPLVAAAVAVLAVLLFWVLVLGPRGAEVTRLDGEIATAQAELDTLNARLTALRAVDLEPLQAELAGYRKSIPSSPDEDGIIQTLVDASNRANVTFEGLQFGSPVASGVAPVSVITVNFTAKGSYFDLAKFLFELEHLERLAYVRTISVSPSEGGLSLALVVDMFTTDTNAGPGSDPAPGPEVGA